MNYWTQSDKYIYVAAHRGWREKYPENTIEAFKAALTLDVDQIETDVRISKDGELVLIHDATVDRTTNGTGKVCDLTLSELKSLSASAGKGEEFAESRIPTLRELMELVKDHPTITLDIELKEYPTEGWEDVSYSVCDRTLAMLDEYGFTDRCVINTFSGKLHEYIHRKYGDKYRRHVYYPEKNLGTVTENPYTSAYCTCVFGILDGSVTAEEARKLSEDTGVRIWAGAYASNEKAIDISLEMKPELITCDNPDVVLDILRRKGLHK